MRPIPAGVLQQIVDRAVKRSFNSITVDSDTSTSDTVLFAATGATEHKVVYGHADDKHLKEFRKRGRIGDGRIGPADRARRRRRLEIRHG